MKYLVTGGAGFIGMNLIQELLSKGHEVYAIDNFSDYYSTNLKEKRVENLIKRDNFRFERVDLVETESFKRILSSFQPEMVIHLAAQPGVRLTLQESDRYARENLMGFHNCLISVIEASIPNLMFASSSSVYGDDSLNPFKETQSNLNPISYYGATKLANEILARALAKSSHTRIRGLRFFTVYGPWGRPDMAYFKLIESALNGSSFPKFGDGSVKRDFTFVNDTVKSIFHLGQNLINQNIGHFDIVNVGGGKPYSLNDLIYEIESQTGKKIIENKLEAIAGDVKLTVADSNILQQLTGQAPETTLEKGIEVTLNWAMQNGIRDKLGSWVS